MDTVNVTFALERVVEHVSGRTHECVLALLRMRAVSSAWRLMGDTVGLTLLCAELGDHGIHRKTAVAMAARLGAGGGIPWACALAWWRCVGALVGLPFIKVAGSAALFVERCLANRDPGFTPGDVDVWTEAGDGVHPDEVGGDATGVWPKTSSDGMLELADSAIGYARSYAGLLTLYRAVRSMEIEGVLRVIAFNPKDVYPFVYTIASYLRYLENQVGTYCTGGKSPEEPHDLVVAFHGGFKMKIQIIYMSHDPPLNCKCDIQRHGCLECMTLRQDERYESNGWCAGMPHRHFDLDAACVALDRDPTKGIIAQRLCGSADGPELTLLPCGLWRLQEDDGRQLMAVIPCDQLTLENRIKKYRARGYSQIRVADSMIICDKTFPTPDWVLSLCQND